MKYILLAFLFLAACGSEEQPTIAPAVQLPVGGTYLFGDSISSEGPATYAHMVKESLGADVYIAGHPGDAVISLLDRVESAIIVNKPAVVTILVGINDAFNYCLSGRFPPNEYEDLYRQLLTKIRAESPETKIILVPPFTFGAGTYNAENVELTCLNTNISAYQTVVENLATEFSLSMIDVNTAILNAEQITQPGDLSEDGVHPNAVGAVILRDEFVKNLK